MFTSITANLSGGVRREKFAGKEYLVAPVTMIVPGVLPGSDGPIYYPPDLLAANPTVWNQVPLVLRHPLNGNSPVSARDPTVLERFGIGFVFRARFDGKLRAEGWFDVERTARIAPSVLSSLERGQQIELSTGAFITVEETIGVHKGRAYDRIARTYVPDHLAILPDQEGACSIADGCGVLANHSSIKRRKKKFKMRFNSYSDSEILDQEDLLVTPTINWAEEATSRQQEPTCNCGQCRNTHSSYQRAADDGDILPPAPTINWGEEAARHRR